jgi:oxygen-independent coproporphyrinogen-3 oxidase
MPQGAALAALYVHWPFCKKKCPYCDFNSHVREGVNHAAWRAALLRELGYWHARAPEMGISSIFFGGGTPSLMEAETVAAVIEEVRRLWPAAADSEITLEANPTSVEAEKFRAFADAGVNRVSLGVQSLRAESLAFLGREHSAREALKAVELAAEIFPRYSFDLIYALPNQSTAVWEAELRDALTHARGHLSLYQLTIEQNTAFHHAYHVGKAFALPDEHLAADLFELTNTIMREAGMPAYEISNYAARGQESRHNLSYWRGDAYFGVGPGAHGRVDVITASTARPSPKICEQILASPQGEAAPLNLLTKNPAMGTRIATHTLKSPERWLEAVTRQGHGVEEEVTLTVAERAEEKLLMSLRLVEEGLQFNRLHADERDYLDTLWRDGRVERLVAQGMVTEDTRSIRATAQGQLVLNRVIEELLA